ncbi:MAG: hypothetical protein PHX18_03010 [Candidatus Gastranaerophilales bacterium]|nr:hypothetical protein [Candidatus Gastranaerophilales bacterium]
MGIEAVSGAEGTNLKVVTLEELQKRQQSEKTAQAQERKQVVVLKGNTDTNNEGYVAGLNRIEHEIASDECTDGVDDGKIGLKEGAKHFGKGALKLVTGIAKRPILAGAVIAAGAVACALGGAPVAVGLLAIGIGMGLWKLGKGIYNICNAKTDKAAKLACQDMGEGTTTLVLSAVGAKKIVNTAAQQGVKTSASFNPDSTRNCMIESFRMTGRAFKSDGLIAAGKAHYKGVGGLSGLGGKVGRFVTGAKNPNAPAQAEAASKTAAAVESSTASTGQTVETAKKAGILKSTWNYTKNLFRKKNTAQPQANAQPQVSSATASNNTPATANNIVIKPDVSASQSPYTLTTDKARLNMTISGNTQSSEMVLWNVGSAVKQAKTLVSNGKIAEANAYINEQIAILQRSGRSCDIEILKIYQNNIPNPGSPYIISTDASKTSMNISASSANAGPTVTASNPTPVASTAATTAKQATEAAIAQSLTASLSKKDAFRQILIANNVVDNARLTITGEKR